MDRVFNQSSSSSEESSVDEAIVTMQEALEAVRGGQFVGIHGYVNEHGEKANVIVHYGTNYKRTRKRDFDKLCAFVGVDPIAIPEDFKSETDADPIINQIAGQMNVSEVKITLPDYYNWFPASLVDGNGIATAIDGSNRKSKSNDTIGKIRNSQAEEQEIREAVVSIATSLLAPKKHTNNYEKIADSAYILDDEETGETNFYLRNVLLHSKEVDPNQKGEYVTKSGDPKASGRATVLKNAIKRILLIGQYRSYKLTEDKFDFLTATGGRLLSSESSEESTSK